MDSIGDSIPWNLACETFCTHDTHTHANGQMTLQTKTFVKAISWNHHIQYGRTSLRPRHSRVTATMQNTMKTPACTQLSRKCRHRKTQARLWAMLENPIGHKIQNAWIIGQWSHWSLQAEWLFSTQILWFSDSPYFWNRSHLTPCRSSRTKCLDTIVCGWETLGSSESLLIFHREYENPNRSFYRSLRSPLDTVRAI